MSLHLRLAAAFFDGRIPGGVRRRVLVLAAFCAVAGLGCSDEPTSPSPTSQSGRTTEIIAGETTASTTPVILIVIDTLRADHLGCYGYPLETSPVLDAFAKTATLFEANSTQVNVTHASITSILTGLYARTHRSYTPVPVDTENPEAKPHLGLAELLEGEDYHTLGAISHPAWQLGSNSPILTGWHSLSVISQEGDGAYRRTLANGAHTNARIFPLLGTYAADFRSKPLFLWAHYFDPHTDLPGLVYDAPKITRNKFLADHLAEAGLEQFEEELAGMSPEMRQSWITRQTKGELRNALQMANGRSLYDAEIRAADTYVGRLFTRLRNLKLYDRAMIIVMADHGENMEADSSMRGQILFTHHRLFQGVTRTPLIIKLPGQKQGRRIPALSQNIDVFPTVLDVLGLDTPEQVEGVSLLPLIRGTETSIHKRVFMESGDLREKAIKTKTLKFIDPGDGSESLVFEWPNDPDELQDRRAELDPGSLEGARRALRNFSPPPAVRVRLEPESSPYTISLEAFIGENDTEEFSGPLRAMESGEAPLFAWNGTVGTEPVELEFNRRRGRSPIAWRIARSDGKRVGQQIFIGAQPLWESAATPVYLQAEGVPPNAPLLRLNHDVESSTYSAELAPSGSASLELTLRPRRASYGFKLAVLSESGFDGSESLSGKSHRFFASAAETASLSVSVEPRDRLLLLRARINGEWPEPSRVMLNGKPVVSSSLSFVYVQSSSSAGIRATAPLPGSVTIEEVDPYAESELDTSEMDAEMIENLRALGYVK